MGSTQERHPHKGWCTSVWALTDTSKSDHLNLLQLRVLQEKRGLHILRTYVEHLSGMTDALVAAVLYQDALLC